MYGNNEAAKVAHQKRNGWGKPINMMNSAHKASTDAYRDGWDRIWGDKKDTEECTEE